MGEARKGPANISKNTRMDKLIDGFADKANEIAVKKMVEGGDFNIDIGPMGKRDVHPSIKIDGNIYEIALQSITTGKNKFKANVVVYNHSEGDIILEATVPFAKSQTPEGLGVGIALDLLSKFRKELD